MKIHEEFECEYCGTTYQTEQGALDCEASHANVELGNLEYKQKSKFPVKISLVCPEDGTKQVYVKA